MIVSPAQLKAKLTEKGATRPSPMMRTKQAAGSTEVQQVPRLRDYAPGADRLAEWQRDVRKSAGGFSKAKRAQNTSNEHDRNMWALNEYAKRQGFHSFVERVQEGEHPEATSSTGILKPTYDASGEMRVVPPELIVSCLLDMGSGSSETPRGGHNEDSPWETGAAAVTLRSGGFGPESWAVVRWWVMLRWHRAALARSRSPREILSAPNARVPMQALRAPCRSGTIRGPRRRARASRGPLGTARTRRSHGA